MTLEEFRSSPWSNSHRAFDESVFNIRPAPEFATGEVVMASLYRANGFSSVAEKEVPKKGRELDLAANRARARRAEGGRIKPETWRTIIDRVIQSPKVSQQSSKRFLSLSPVVPDVALYSGSARLAGNPWNPGELVRRVIQMGAPAPGFASATWGELHAALSVQDKDDIWAKWLQQEFESRRAPGVSWSATPLDDLGAFPYEDRSEFQYPAKRFVVDLHGILEAKGAMTRRQWVSLLESVLRIGTVSHVLWLCHVNDKLWRLVSTHLGMRDDPVPANRREFIESVLSVKPRMLSYGNPAVPTIRDYASRYLAARLGINAVMWTMKEVGVEVPTLRGIDGLMAFAKAVAHSRDRLQATNLVADIRELSEGKQAAAIACKKGIGSNLVEFCQYTLGQRQTLEPTLRGYDQGYFLRKRSDEKRAPWVLAMGPAAVLAMAHCCLNEVRGPRSVQRLSAHLAAYGIEFEVKGLNDSDLGHQLRMLGLVLDSPDAESGMLLVPPFAT